MFTLLGSIFLGVSVGIAQWRASKQLNYSDTNHWDGGKRTCSGSVCLGK